MQPWPVDVVIAQTRLPIAQLGALYLLGVLMATEQNVDSKSLEI